MSDTEQKPTEAATPETPETPAETPAETPSEPEAPASEGEQG